MERTRIIIADDESIVRTDLKEMLTNLGYLVVGEVGDGRSAVNLARELKPDVVIMDIKMPDMDGIEAAKILTEEQIAPVILYSSFVFLLKIKLLVHVLSSLRCKGTLSGYHSPNLISLPVMVTCFSGGCISGITTKLTIHSSEFVLLTGSC